MEGKKSEIWDIPRSYVKVSVMGIRQIPESAVLQFLGLLWTASMIGILMMFAWGVFAGEDTPVVQGVNLPRLMRMFAIPSIVLVGIIAAVPMWYVVAARRARMEVIRMVGFEARFSMLVLELERYLESALTSVPAGDFRSLQSLSRAELYDVVFNNIMEGGIYDDELWRNWANLVREYNMSGDAGTVGSIKHG